MRLRTRLTERFGIEHPIILAPMGVLAGGRLAAAVSNGGGLGLIGGGYGDAAWLDAEFAAAGDARAGCGFITWSLANAPELLDLVLARRPAALMLSFGAPEPFATRVRAAGVPLICQVQSMPRARAAIAAGADVIVAQGTESGGHSGTRSMLNLVPEVADLLAATAPDTILVAAGGIADGRTMAAALMLGADGVLVGTRFIVSPESAAPAGFHAAIVQADGDSTIKTRTVDIARHRFWPEPDLVARVLRNRFVATWHGREAELTELPARTAASERYWAAFDAGDADNTGVLMGEAAGIIHEVRPAAGIMADMVEEAGRLLAAGPRLVAG